MDITQSKSILAKLMAGEKINVVHGNYPTASFDLKSRTIHLPIWKNMDGFMYDLLTGHEVGHALETPEQGWHDAISTNRKFKSFLNVIEDARIEKKVKRQYPGLSQSFAKAYNELHKRDFFGINRLTDLNSLNLIDRINLYFKIGAYLHVPFKENEMEFVNEVSNIETWEQVVDVATRVYDYVKENEGDKIQDMSDLNDTLYAQKEESEENDSDDSDDSDSENDFDMSDESYSFGDESDEESEENSDDSSEDSSEDSDDADGSGDSDDSSEEDGEESDSDSSESSEEDGSEEGGSDIDGGSSSEDDEQVSEDDGEPESFTDSAFRKRENELVNQTGEVAFVQLPTPILSNIVQSPNSVIDSLSRQCRYYINEETRTSVIDKCVQNFNQKNAGYINLLSQQFEMRKNAAQYSRTRTSRTGILDTNKLHQYRTSNSLFKSAEIITKGKNHGMMMFIDMSGSMSSSIRNVIEQTLIMVAFCKRVRIPFEVYGFSDCPHDFPRDMDATKPQFVISSNINSLDISPSNFHLKQFFTDTMSVDQYRKMFGLMCAVIERKFELYLGGTPLSETIIVSRTLIDNFRARTNVENMNVIHLTDGEGYGLRYMNEKNESTTLYYCPKLEYPVFIIDPITQKRVDATNGYFQDALTKLVADVTGSNMIAFYITDHAHGYVNAQSSKNCNNVDTVAVRKKFLDDNCGVLEDYRGYQNYMFVRIMRNRKETGEVIDTSVSNSKLATSILKGMRSSAANKTMATKFASMLTV
jgi:hypothetical protein